MRIDDANISAYGVLVDRRIQPADGLTVLFGRNEAGKTTLKRFIETMLFGFDDDAVEAYTPWHADGHDFGGQLAYTLSNGTCYQVQRYYDPSVRVKRNRESASLLVGADGSGGQADMAADEIGAAHLRQRRAIFRTVFSIDLNALVALQDLGDDETEAVAEVFFRELATVGEVASPNDVLSDLHERAVAICNFGGSRKRKPQETILKKKLNEARKVLRASKQAEAEAERLQERIAELGGQRRDRIAEQARVDTALDAIRNLEPVVLCHAKLWEAREALAQYADLADVDVETLREIESDLTEQKARAVPLDQARKDEQSLARRLSELRERQEQLSAVDSVGPEVERLARRCDYHEQLAEELTRQADDLAFRRSRLTAELTEIASVEDASACRGLRMTQVRREALTREVEDVGEAERELAEQERNVAALGRRIEKLSAEIEHIEPRVPDDFPSDYRPAALRELLALQRERDRLDTMHEMAEDRRQQLKRDRRQLAALRKEASRQQGVLSGAAPTYQWVLWSLAVLSGLGVAGYYGAVGQVEGIVAGAAFAVLGVWALVDLRQRHQAAKTVGESEEAHPILQALTEDIQTAEDFLEREAPKTEEHARRLAERSEQLGLGPTPAAEEIENAVARLQAFDDAAADHQRLESVRREHKELVRERDEALKKLDDIRRRRDACRQTVESSLVESDLVVPEAWTPASLRDRLEIAGRLADRLADIEREQNAHDQARGQHEEFLAQVRALAERLGDRAFPSEPRDAAPGPQGSRSPAADRPDITTEPFAYVRHVARLLEESAALRVRIADEEEARKTLQARIEQAESEQEALGKRLAERLRRVGLETPEALPALRSRLEERRQHEIRAQSLSEQFEDLRQAADLPEDWQPSEDAESSETAADAEKDPERLRARRTELTQQIEEQGEEISRLKRDLDMAMRETPVEVAEGTYQAVLDELAEAYEEFDALLVAHQLLDRGMKQYQRQRQPAIVRAAQGYLKELTAGRYDTLQTDLLSRAKRLGEIRIVPPAGQPRDAEAFSRGAREQIYLALRLALADELSQAEPLPLILDDVLVNFDDHRFDTTADLLTSLGRQRQILFLTCHEDIRDALVRHGAEAREL